jgi:hypothetical protein
VKPRHTAALALLGWYLMMPTPNGDNSLRYEPQLPLSKWRIVQSFDSAYACDASLADHQKLTAKDKDLKNLRNLGDASSAGRLAFLYGLAECIETDDPRLAK